ncbi:type IV pilin protein [Demequina silvatica]|uniref:type IV pilin protein n=1 Tax=Demequina silvatica TaxID=1638988 RepID=UPI000B019565|nr:prepilin-type N-terminal cleavage/methylation domain-containing protein [Demequina silvatica]
MWGRFTRRDGGYSMVELVVVIVIIGVLAAVAIPLYLNHQNKANDAAAQSDAMNLGTLIRAAYDENTTVVDVDLVDGEYVIDGDPVLAASPGVEFVAWTPGDIDSWCVQLMHPNGDVSDDPGVRFDAQNGYVENAECS